MSEDPVLARQIDYYRAMAATGRFDRAYARTGEYARDDHVAEQWNRELDAVARALDAESDVDEVVELACGTGRWTSVLARRARHVVGVDAAPEMLRIHEERTAGLPVERVCADVMSWSPERPPDLVVMCLWLSHVPPAAFDSFWRHVLSWSAPETRYFLMDSLPHADRVGTDETAPDSSRWLHRRTLPDGTTVDIPKVFYDGDDLKARLGALGLESRLDFSSSFFFFGSVERTKGVAKTIPDVRRK